MTKRKAAKCEQAILTYRNATDPCVSLHVLAALEWMLSEPLRTITSVGFKEWMDQQRPEWSSGYRRMIKSGVEQLIHESQTATADQVKSRLMQLVDQLLPTCKELVMGTAVGGGTMIMVDPDSGKRLTKYNHQAIHAYLKLMAEMTGAIAKVPDPSAQHLHLHLAKGADLSGIPDDKLDEMIEANKREILRIEREQAAPVIATTKED